MFRCTLIVAVGSESGVIGGSITAGCAAERMSNYSIALACLRRQIG